MRSSKDRGLAGCLLDVCLLRRAIRPREEMWQRTFDFASKLIPLGSPVTAALPVVFIVTDPVLDEAEAIKDRVLVALRASRYEVKVGSHYNRRRYVFEVHLPRHSVGLLGQANQLISPHA